MAAPPVVVVACGHSLTESSAAGAAVVLGLTSGSTRGADRQTSWNYTDLVAAAQAGALPAVSFYKPQGNLNQHAGYANVEDGVAHIAGLIEQLKTRPQWHGMLIVVTTMRTAAGGTTSPRRRATCSGPARAFPR
jgi:phospholipase C